MVGVRDLFLPYLRARPSVHARAVRRGVRAGERLVARVVANAATKSSDELAPA